jgi:hypothetical protein
MEPWAPPGGSTEKILRTALGEIEQWIIQLLSAADDEIYS